MLPIIISSIGKIKHLITAKTLKYIDENGGTKNLSNFPKTAHLVSSEVSRAM
jgi:hypothetical protein